MSKGRKDNIKNALNSTKPYEARFSPCPTPLLAPLHSLSHSTPCPPPLPVPLHCLTVPLSDETGGYCFLYFKKANFSLEAKILYRLPPAGKLHWINIETT